MDLIDKQTARNVLASMQGRSTSKEAWILIRNSRIWQRMGKEKEMIKKVKDEVDDE